MATYIRNHVPGGSYYLHVCLQDRDSDLLIRELPRLRKAMRYVLMANPMRIDAITVLPAEIHTIWTLPEGDSAYSLRVAQLKATFSRDLPAAPTRSPSQLAHRRKGIWQKRFWEHTIRSSADFQTHLEQVLHAPVQAGLCAMPADWAHSSIHRDRWAQTRLGITAAQQIPSRSARLA
ncbi:transposase [Aliishimia ponticola]|uniref:Transposase n=1 Tax=Aliishimia ponticola TaxID=2499833 RepID=A0A4S4NS11_9RHOB|nr:transposase [Aliishimia ponticola]THH39020.1 transposase [Aliishimia ponticola]